jgi:hypothetical protein
VALDDSPSPFDPNRMLAMPLGRPWKPGATTMALVASPSDGLRRGSPLADVLSLSLMWAISALCISISLLSFASASVKPPSVDVMGAVAAVAALAMGGGDGDSESLGLFFASCFMGNALSGS